MRKIALAVVGLVLAGWFVTGVTQVRPGERAVVRRFGKVIAVPPPGLFIGLPWGMDRVDRVPADFVRRVKVGFDPDQTDDSSTAPPGQLLTGDHNLVNIQVEVQYSVAQEIDEQQVVDYLLHADRTDALVGRVVEAVTSEWVAQRRVEEVLLEGTARLPEIIVPQTQERIASYQLGVRILSASVTHLLPPDQVKPAFDAVTRAHTSRKTQKHKAMQEADRIVREAEMKAVESEQATAAEAKAAIDLARADAETFVRRVQEYHRLRQQNPNVLAAIWWDEMARLLLNFKERGRIDLLDRHLGPDGLDITLIAPPARKR
jgi:membrane protease subunit HflK